MRAALLLGITSWLSLVSAPAWAQHATGSADAAAGLTGFWALRYDSRNTPRATLLPPIGPKTLARRQADDQHAIRWCHPVGMPALMDSDAPIGIVQGEAEIAISTEAPSAPRHIYLNRAAPDPVVFEPSTNGFSRGHWDGQVLVVETSGFNTKGETLIPGGGFRTTSSILTERFQLLNGGRELQVSSTWTDPKVFAVPHSYAYRYVRLPQSYNFGEFFCDTNDSERAGFLTQAPGDNRGEH